MVVLVSYYTKLKPRGSIYLFGARFVILSTHRVKKKLRCSAVIQPMGGGGSRTGDPSITTADYDFPAPQRTGNSCDVQMALTIKNPSIHISDFRTGMRSPPCF